MAQQDRDEQGRFEEKVRSEDILSMFEDGEPISATDVADRFDISNRAALNKLDRLKEEGEIERKNVGSRAVVWWKPE
jgi:predicted ArsR family transcriptional regulator